MPAAPFAEVVVVPMCFFTAKGIDVAMIVHGDDFFVRRLCSRQMNTRRTSSESILCVWRDQVMRKKSNSSSV